MKLLAWPPSLTVAAQLTFTAAPHPYGTPHKSVATLFAPRVTMPQTSAEPKMKVVCGMLMVEANPKHDPKMTAEPRRDITFAIRTHPRPACGQQN